MLKVALHVTLFMDMLKQMSNPKRGALVAIQSRIAAERQKPLVSQVANSQTIEKGSPKCTIQKHAFEQTWSHGLMPNDWQ